MDTSKIRECVDNGPLFPCLEHPVPPPFLCLLQDLLSCHVRVCPLTLLPFLWSSLAGREPVLSPGRFLCCWTFGRSVSTETCAVSVRDGLSFWLVSWPPVRPSFCTSGIHFTAEAPERYGVLKTCQLSQPHRV